MEEANFDIYLSPLNSSQSSDDYIIERAYIAVEESDAQEREREEWKRRVLESRRFRENIGTRALGNRR